MQNQKKKKKSQKRLEKVLVDEGLIKPGDVLFTPNCYEDKTPRSVYKHQDEVREVVSALKLADGFSWTTIFLSVTESRQPFISLMNKSTS